MVILVEWASCPCHWNGDLAVEWASCPFQFPGRHPAHSTPIDRAGILPTLLLFNIFGRASCPLYSYSFFSRFPTPDSRFPIPDSRFPIP
ncbi:MULTISPECIES: hypothetical protein [Moorena]|uniref:hypothetical protein n=1 Tax=Moorena TaxID=1155738 RepID=UPI0002D6D09F|nr:MULTISPECIES: hypothetical protein [Moorena]NEP64036.1 hypothetical protein [Moorena sp. SIO3A5]